MATTLQSGFFDGVNGARNAAPFPAGLLYRPEFIGRGDEEAPVGRVRELTFRDSEFHGHTGKRRVISFGWHYDFTGRRLRKADDIPTTCSRSARPPPR